MNVDNAQPEELLGLSARIDMIRSHPTIRHERIRPGIVAVRVNTTINERLNCVVNDVMQGRVGDTRFAESLAASIDRTENLTATNSTTATKLSLHRSAPLEDCCLIFRNHAWIVHLIGLLSISSLEKI
jgi:hypothetical protein